MSEYADWLVVCEVDSSYLLRITFDGHLIVWTDLCSEIAKTALGAEKSVPYVYAKSTVGIINRLRKEGFEIVAIEQTKNSVDYRKLRVGSKVAFIVGNEVLGVSDKVLKLCDYVAEIPLRGEKESLNAAVS